jgi:hypothetical protein
LRATRLPTPKGSQILAGGGRVAANHRTGPIKRISAPRRWCQNRTPASREHASVASGSGTHFGVHSIFRWLRWFAATRPPPANFCQPSGLGRLQSLVDSQPSRGLGSRLSGACRTPTFPLRNSARDDPHPVILTPTIARVGESLTRRLWLRPAGLCNSRMKGTPYVEEWSFHIGRICQVPVHATGLRPCACADASSTFCVLELPCQ